MSLMLDGASATYISKSIKLHRYILNANDETKDKGDIVL
jgi:hypothetical protein